MTARPRSRFFRCCKHAHRTSGFFKIRGINLNHSEFEDFMFRIAEIGDFKAEAMTRKELDVLRLSIEVRARRERQ